MNVKEPGGGATYAIAKVRNKGEREDGIPTERREFKHSQQGTFSLSCVAFLPLPAELGTSVQSVRAALEERQREAEQHSGGASDSEQRRIAHLKGMLSDRRATALLAFASGSGQEAAADRSAVIQALLRERRGGGEGERQQGQEEEEGEGEEEEEDGPMEFSDDMSLLSDTPSQAEFKKLPAHERLIKAGMEWCGFVCCSLSLSFYSDILDSRRAPPYV